MNAYVDSSVLLRVLLGQRGALAEWRSIRLGVASALVEVESLRTLDRLRLAGRITTEQLAERRESVFRLVEEMEVVEPRMIVSRRASQPFPTPLGTLDAVHLSTALLWQQTRGEEIVMATHDAALATAARASGLRVAGA